MLHVLSQFYIRIYYINKPCSCPAMEDREVMQFFYGNYVFHFVKFPSTIFSYDHCQSQGPSTRPDIHFMPDSNYIATWKRTKCLFFHQLLSRKKGMKVLYKFPVLYLLKLPFIYSKLVSSFHSF